MSETPSERDLRRAMNQQRWTAASYERAVRFHLALNVAFGAAALGLLKIEGPYFADAIAAALFTCGFLTCLLGIRCVRESEGELAAATVARGRQEVKAGLREGEPPAYVSRSRGIVLVLSCFALFHLGSAIATVWLTYVVAVEANGSGFDTLAAIWLPARVCSGSGL